MADNRCFIVCERCGEALYIAKFWQGSGWTRRSVTEPSKGEGTGGLGESPDNRGDQLNQITEFMDGHYQRHLEMDWPDLADDHQHYLGAMFRLVYESTPSLDIDYAPKEDPCE